MKQLRTLILGAIIILSSCQQGLPAHTAGKAFMDNFLHNGSRVRPGADLQVYLADRLRPADYPGVTATLTLQDGTTIALQSADFLPGGILVVIPLAPLPPDSAYTLTITAGGKIIVINFTTASPGGGLPPVVTITAPSDGDTVSGMVEVDATATDDAGLAGNIFAIIDGATFAWRPDSPARFYLNTALLADGPHTLTVSASDVDALTGSTTITVNASNPTPNSVGFVIPDEGLEPADGVIPSAGLVTAMGFEMTLTVYALTDADYTNWAATGYKVGDMMAGTYTASEFFTTGGVACLEFFNYAAGNLALPATTLVLTLPDHSALTVNLPATSIPSFYHAIFYVSADGGAHWANTAGGPVDSSTPPDRSPTAALAIPSP